MSFFVSILMFAIVLSILVFVHELGHLMAAKYFNVYCSEFAIGMGPTVFKLKKPNWETTYSIRALPLGGFVAMAGEPGEEAIENLPIERTMLGIARWKRIIIMLAGIFMNLVLAVVIYTGLFAANGVVEPAKPIVATVVEGSPADHAGFQAGDHITKLEFEDGTVIIPKVFMDMQTAVQTYQGRPLTVTVDRSGTQQIMTLSPQKDPASGAYLIGVSALAGEHRQVGIFEAFRLSFVEINATVSQMVFLLTRAVRGIGVDNLGGPIAIFGVTSQIQTYGAIFFFNIVAMLSVNLAVVNLLPIPIMDGGRVVLTLIEMIIRRPIPEKIENAIMMIGLVMVVAFFIFITSNDIMRQFS